MRALAIPDGNGWSSIDKQKMNNTKTSRLSIKTIKPNGFRLFLKQRTNHHEPINPSNPHPLRHDSSQTALQTNTQTISKMKDFVRARIKTENSAASQSQSHLNPKAAAAQRTRALNATAMERFKDTPEKPASSLSDLKVKLSTSQSNFKDVSKGNLSSLSALEEKAERLLMQKLQHCSNFKDQSSRELEEQLRDLIKQIRSVDCNPEGTPSAAVQLINSKIQLLEKLMAENMAEGDLMRKHLLSRLASKAKGRRVHTEVFPGTEQVSYRDTQPPRETVVNTSSNQESFRSPGGPAYNIYRYRQQYLDVDRHRQPLPRSSYNRDFLLYDQRPETGILPAPNIIIGRSSSANAFRSSYRDSFGPKHTHRVNIRELDACKDKIKNIPIDFTRRNRTNSGFLNYDISRERSVPRRYQEPPGVGGRYLLSESRREFTEQAYRPCAGAIKHENLQRWHYQYKKALHA